jgi:hypothetical protein
LKEDFERAQDHKLEEFEITSAKAVRDDDLARPEFSGANYEPRRKIERYAQWKFNGGYTRPCQTTASGGSCGRSGLA